jgi:hypothetical protein
MKLLILYETDRESLEIKQKDVCLAIFVATAGIHKWNRQLSLSCDACRSKGFRYRLCALFLNADVRYVPDLVVNVKERRGAPAEATHK